MHGFTFWLQCTQPIASTLVANPRWLPVDGYGTRDAGSRPHPTPRPFTARLSSEQREMRGAPKPVGAKPAASLGVRDDSTR